MSISDPDMVEFRDAVAADLPAVVELLRDDILGRDRETDDLEPYRRAFERIEADPHHRLVVGIFHREPVCCAQLSILPGLGHGGATVAQIEGVRVMSAMRGRGIGYVLVDHLMSEARKAGADQVQLMSSNERTGAQRFYARLGFEPSHVGMKRSL
ncbi:MAG: GNAT family N-acetyltransferase [Acidimicrobiales bacterium]